MTHIGAKLLFPHFSLFIPLLRRVRSFHQRLAPLPARRSSSSSLSFLLLGESCIDDNPTDHPKLAPIISTFPFFLAAADTEFDADALRRRHGNPKAA